MRMTLKLTSFLAVATILGLVACGDDDVDVTPDPDSGVPETDGGPRKDANGNDDEDSGRKDASTDAKPDAKDSGSDADADAEDPIKQITLKVEDVIKAEAPVGPSTYGFASSQDAFGGVGTSWRYQKPFTGADDEKFEFYLPFTAADAKGALSDITTYLGDVTLADLASVKVRSRRNTADSPDFMMLVYTVPHANAAENDASWYAQRLHAGFAWAASPNAPASTWNTFSTAAGTNELRFWDFRNANANAGVQPNANYFSLANIQAGPVTPTGVTGARDYHAEKIRFIAFSSVSNDTTFDASIDGIEVVLKNGKGVSIDLAGDASFRRIALSRAKLLAVDPPDTGSTYGTASATNPWHDAGTSWKFTKNAATNEKLEFYLTFGGALDTPKTAIWKGVREHLGEFTVADIDALSVHSYKANAARDFTAIIYTQPKATGNDATWYSRRLHAGFEWAATPNAPINTWNQFSTAVGDNQLRFWDFRHSNVALGEQPSGTNYFTLADIQAGPVTPAGVTGARDYNTEKVQFISFSTPSGLTEFDGAIDGIEIRLKNGKSLVVDLDK
jgi:hypothetical protein